MRKLALELDDLAVESFETAAAEPSRGTVDAYQTTGNQIICECTYDVGTCDYTCADTCAASCNGGCGTGGSTHDATCATGDQIICGC